MGRKYTVEYKNEALELAKEVGASLAARQLNIPIDTLYTWISKSKLLDTQKPSSKAKNIDLSDKMKRLEEEVKILRGENAMLIKERKTLEDAMIFFVSRQKK